MEDEQLQKMFLSGGVTNILTLGLFFLLKIINKKCDKTKRSECKFCGSSCTTVNKETWHGERPRELDLEEGRQL